MAEVHAIRSADVGQVDQSKPPHSIEAEQQLIGAVLANNERFGSVADIVSAETFFDPVHGRIWTAMGARIEAGKLASPVTLKQDIGTDPGLKELGGPPYLARLMGASLAAFAIRDYAEIIVDLHAQRKLVEAWESVRAKHGLDGASAEIATKMQEAIQAMPRASGKPWQSSLGATIDMIKEMNSAYQGEADLIKTGIRDLDAIIGGFDVGEFVVLGGATSMAKTATAINIARNIGAVNPTMRVPFVTAEMPAKRLMQRMISMQTGIPYRAMREAGRLSEADFRRIVEAAKFVGESTPIDFIERNTVGDIDAAITDIMRTFKGGVSAVFIDYAQLIKGPGWKKMEQQEFVADWLQERARQWDVPVIALVQVSRDLINRTDRRPHLTDIRETGKYENNCDIAIMCHREDYWIERDGPKPDKTGKITDLNRVDWEADLAAARGKIELIVRKGRGSGLGTATCKIDLPTGLISDIGQDEMAF